MTITGTNDLPTISGGAIELITEAGLPEGTAPNAASINATGRFNLMDVDDEDTLTLNVNGKAIGTMDGQSSTV